MSTNINAKPSNPNPIRGIYMFYRKHLCMGSHALVAYPNVTCKTLSLKKA